MAILSSEELFGNNKNVISSEELFASQAQNVVSSEELFIKEKPREQKISTMPEQSYWDKFQSWVRTPNITKDRASNIVGLSEQTGATPTDILRNYPQDTEQVFAGTGAVTPREKIEAMATPAIMGGVAFGVATAPIPTAIALGTFMGLDELVNVAVSKIKNDPYEFQGGKGLSELFEAEGLSRDALDLVEFALEGYGAGKISKLPTSLRNTVRKITASEEKIKFINEVAKEVKDKGIPIEEAVKKTSETKPLKQTITTEELNGLEKTDTLASESPLETPSPKISLETPGQVPANAADIDVARVGKETAPDTPTRDFLGKTGTDKPEIKTTEEILGTGETKVRGLAQSEENSAIEKALIENRGDLGELPTYNVRNIAEPREKVQRLLDTDPEKAFRIIEGKESPPDGLFPEDVFTGIRIRAELQGDVETLQKLLMSSEITEATTLGRRIQALDSGNMDSPFKAMQEISKIRIEDIKKRTGKAPNAKELSVEVDRLSKELEATRKAFEDRLATLETQKAEKAIDDIIKPKAKPTVKYGSTNKIVTTDRYMKIRTELKKELGGTKLSAGIDPMLFEKMGEIGIYHLEAGTRAFAIWSTRMVADLGPAVKPYLKDLFDNAKGKTRKITTETISGKISKSIESGKDLPEVGIMVQRLAKSFVEQGVTERDALVKEVHTVLKDIIPDITERETMDAISGYGKYKLLDKSEVMVQLRDIKGQLQQVAKLDDLQRKQSFAKTGIERRIPSEEESKLIKEVNLLKRKYGITQADGAAQLKALKTRLKNDTILLQDKIKNLNFAPKERKITVLDADAKTAKAKHEAVKESYKALAEAAGIITKEEATKLVKLSTDMTDYKKNYNPETREWTSPKDKATYGAARVLYVNYANSLKEPTMPIRKMVKGRLEEAKTTWKDNKAKAALELTTDTLKEIADNSVAMVATLDNSFVGRQGFATFWTHPTKWWNGAKNSFADFAKTLGGKNTMDALMADVYSRPRYMNGEYKKAGLVSISEEQFPTSLPGRVPGIGRAFKASEVAFKGSGLRMRLGVYDLLADRAEAGGVNMLDGKHAQDFGTLINSLTARGKWGKTGAPRIVTLVMWAPNMLKGQWDVLTAHNLGSGLETSFARKEAAKNILKIIVGTATLMTVANAIKPGSAETNPTSSDFGKIKIGDTRFNYTGGANALIILAARLRPDFMGGGEYKSVTTGKMIKYAPGFGKRSRFDAVIDFLANKTNPPASMVRDWLRGRTFDNKEFTAKGAAHRAFTPISVQQAIQLKDNASADRVAGVLADVIGINATSFEDKKHRNNKFR